MNKQHLFLYRLFLAISDAQQSSIAKKCFDIWVILKMATVKSLEPRNNSLRINHIVRCRFKLSLLGFLKFVLVLILL